MTELYINRIYYHEMWGTRRCLTTVAQEPQALSSLESYTSMPS